SASLAAVAVYWEDRAVIVPDYGYTLEQADINKFALGEFRSSAASGNAQPINGNSVSSGLPNYQIKFEGGAGILREIEPL
ncbi:MAG: hypothetical protein FWH38_07340, partial [Treponema sp.]|nr:hypothetical protein [Treponema sp.]